MEKRYCIKRRLSKRKILRMIRDHMGGLDERKECDFTFSNFGNTYLVEYYRLGMHVEIWFHHFAGAYGFRVDYWCYLSEYDEHRTFVESQFYHVPLEYLVEHGLYKEVAS